MNDLKEQLTRFRTALKFKPQAAAFDIDGTLTDVAEHAIPRYIAEALTRLLLIMPVAICTGRKLEHTDSKLEPIFKSGLDTDFVRMRLTMLCENGSIGYLYNPEMKKYEEFYRIDYPYSKKNRANLFEDINNKLAASISSTWDNETSMVFQVLDVNDTNTAALHARSFTLANEIAKIVSDHDSKNLLKVATSGIGVIVFPKFGDKKDGIFKWAKLLKEKHGFQIGGEAEAELEGQLREIMVVGDKPGTYGNDETFLDGTYGTPFTVGDTVKHRKYPVPVFDLKSRERVFGANGTLTLLKSLKLV